MLAIQLELDGGLSPAAQRALQLEAQQCAHHPVEGTIEPRFLETTQERLVLYLDPVHPGAVRLDQLLAVLPDRSLDPSLAATLVGTLAQVVHQVHQTPGPLGAARAHLELHPRAVVLTPGGTLALLGAGLPTLTELLIAEPRWEADRFRPMAPEQARGEAVGPATDVYALGVLYYELLAGQPYRAAASATALCTLAIEGAPPDLPGALVGARPSLLAVLRRALAPEAEARPRSALALATEIATELHGAGFSPAPPDALARLLDRLPPYGTVVGPMALIAPAADLSEATQAVRPRAHPIADDLAEFAPRAPTAAAPGPIDDGWSKVLGEAKPVPSEPGHRPPHLSEPPAPPPAESATPPVPTPPRLKLPGATKTSAGSPPAKKEELPVAASPALSGMAEVVEAAVTGNSPRGKPKTNANRIGYVVAAGVLLLTLGALALSRLPKDEVPPVSEANEAVAEEADPGPEEADDAGAPAAIDAGTRRRRGPAEVAASDPAESRPLGLLTVNSKPSGATVELDGGYVGNTPLVLRHAFSARPYVVTIMAEGHRRWQRSIEPDPKSQTITVMATLEKE